MTTTRKLIMVLALMCLSMGNVLSQNLDSWPKTVLITNDDGINDPKMIGLAKAFSKVAETYVVAPSGDKSGTTHYTSVFSIYQLTVEKKNIGEGIKAYAVDGYPGDCVLLALQGIMKDTKPDLVISGINGGPNLGYDWLASGTIGAARLASYWGVPSIAVSGIKDGLPETEEALINWVIEFSKSDLVRQLKTGQYFTLSFPRLSLSEIKGIKVAARAGILADFSFSKIQSDSAESNKEVWQLNRPKPITDVDAESDAALYYSGYIIVVPMLADEIDYPLLSKLKNNSGLLPEWK
ncbi:MAG: 5'/3'-nucleotidase SurE [Bacteroidota bacterium]